MVLFSRKDVAYAIHEDGVLGMQFLADVHRDNDTIETSSLGRLRFRKSKREGAFVLNITLD